MNKITRADTKQNQVCGKSTPGPKLADEPLSVSAASSYPVKPNRLTKPPESAEKFTDDFCSVTAACNSAKPTSMSECLDKNGASKSGDSKIVALRSVTQPGTGLL